MLSASLLRQRRPSVCLSVTLLYCVKTTQLRLMKSSLWATARTLVFSWQIFVPLGEGIPLERGRLTRVPPVKSRHFTAIGSSRVKTVAHICTDMLLIITSTADELSSGTNIDDLERPWPWIWVLSEFFAILGCDAHLEWIFAEIYWR